MEYIDELIEHIRTVQITAMNGMVVEYNTGIMEMVNLLRNIRDTGNKIFFCGNGGSAGIAIHMTADFMKNGKLRTYCLYNPATMTCLANDFSYQKIFSEQINALAEQDDLLFAISSSGESENIIRAAEEMRDKKGKVITFTGFLPNNTLRGKGDTNIYVSISRFGIVESIHNIILQQLVDLC